MQKNSKTRTEGKERRGREGGKGVREGRREGEKGKKGGRRGRKGTDRRLLAWQLPEASLVRTH